MKLIGLTETIVRCGENSYSMVDWLNCLRVICFCDTCENHLLFHIKVELYSEAVAANGCLTLYALLSQKAKVGNLILDRSS